MTVSSTRCSASVAERVRRGALALVLVALPVFAASDVSIRYAEIVRTEEGYVVNADVDLSLNPRLAEAVTRGISLYFVAEFVVERPRWYWFNQVVVERNLEYRLSYHAITRSYRLSVGTLHRSFDTLEEAVQTMRRIRNWHIVPARRLEAGTSYNAALRFRLDPSLLPKPFQVTAIGSRDWKVGTDWMEWTFLAGAPR